MSVLFLLSKSKKAILIQRLFRGYRVRREFKKLKDAIILLQYLWRKRAKSRPKKPIQDRIKEIEEKQKRIEE